MPAARRTEYPRRRRCCAEVGRCRVVSAQRIDQPELSACLHTDRSAWRWDCRSARKGAVRARLARRWFCRRQLESSLSFARRTHSCGGTITVTLRLSGIPLLSLLEVVFSSQQKTVRASKLVFWCVVVLFYKCSVLAKMPAVYVQPAKKVVSRGTTAVTDTPLFLLD